MTAWKVALLSVLTLTALWLLSPSRSMAIKEPGVVEISYMGPGGPISGATDDAVREFEAWSRAEHAKNPAQPIYKVVSGQNASRNQTEDPTRFLVSVAGGTPPDVIRFDRFAVTEWAARNAFEPLDRFIEADIASGHPDAIRPDEFYKSAWDEVVYKDVRTGTSGVFAIPEKMDNRLLYYNKDLLKRSGFVDEQGEARPPKTWEELEEMATKLTEYDAQGRIARLGFAPNVGNAWLYFYGWQNGGEFMSEDGLRCTLNDPKIVSALEWMTRMYKNVGGAAAVMAFQGSMQGGDLDPFITGRIAMMVDGSWKIIDNLAQYGQDLNWGVVPAPLPKARLEAGAKPFSWVSGWSHAIPSTSKNKEAAWALVRYLTSQRAAEVAAESSRLTMESQGRVFIPEQKGRRLVNDALFEKYVYSKPDMDPKIAAAMRLFNDALETGRFRPVTPVGQLLWNEHRSATERAIYEKESAQASLDRSTANVQRQLDRVLAPPRGVVLDFRWLIACYVVLLVALVVGVFRWDTSNSFRRRVVFWKKSVAGEDGEAAPVEGVQSSYFRSQWRGGWICAAPWIIGFVVFTGGPLLFSIVMSFCDYDVLNPPRLTGFGNYVWMFTNDPLFGKSMVNTLYMMIGIPLGMALSLAIAMLLNTSVKGIAMWRTFFYLPSIVPAVATSILWIWMLNPSAGLLNGVLASFGIHGPNWLQDETTSKPSLILMGLWGAGGGMIIWLAGLKGISESLYEAASLDGASAWQQFCNVTVPMLSPYIFFNLIMGLIGTFQTFTQAFIMTEGGPVNSTLFYAYHLFNNAFRYLEMGYACALGWVLFIIVLALTLLQMKLSKHWVHYETD